MTGFRGHFSQNSLSCTYITSGEAHLHEVYLRAKMCSLGHQRGTLGFAKVCRRFARRIGAQEEDSISPHAESPCGRTQVFHEFCVLKRSEYPSFHGTQRRLVIDNVCFHPSRHLLPELRPQWGEKCQPGINPTPPTPPLQ